MLKNNKKASFYIIPFIISFIFIIFVQSLNINGTKNIPLKSEKENAVFFEKSSNSVNYISMRTARSGAFEIFTGRDSLPNFVKKIEEHFFFQKKLKLSERKIGEVIPFSSILQRYKERILRI